MIRKTPSAEAAERRGDHLDLAVIFGLGDQDAGDQRADDRRQAGGGGGEAGDDHDQQADRRGTAPGSWSAPPGRTGAAAAKRPSTSIATITSAAEPAASSSRPSEPVACGVRRQRAEREDDRDDAPDPRTAASRSAERPTGLRRPDQRQHQRGRGQAPARGRARARRSSSGRSATAPTPISSAPRRAARPRRPRTPAAASPHSRRNDSSSPIEKSSRMMPNSANGSIASGLVMVT